jgi:hypothetical protein
MTLDDKGSRSRQSLVVPSTASRHYDNLYRKKWSRHCTKDKTYVGSICSILLSQADTSRPANLCHPKRYLPVGEELV